MNIHDYQSKDLLKEYGVNVPRGYVAFTVEEAVENAKKLGSDVTVVKAQIHAGGRGKAGGVKIAKSLEEVEQYAKELLGKTLVTHQTGPEGKEVKRLLIEEGSNIDKEYYIGLVLDESFESRADGFCRRWNGNRRSRQGITGENFHGSDRSISRLDKFPSKKNGVQLELPERTGQQSCKTIAKLVQSFRRKRLHDREINPLVTTKEGEVVALNAKINFDENALYRHPEILELRDFDEEDPNEIEASKHGLSYIKLDGNIGCMVNGAGLAMATMDIIKYHGGNPANFLDVGGNATAEKVAEAFKIILSDENVKGIFVNVFRWNYEVRQHRGRHHRSDEAARIEHSARRSFGRNER